MAFETISVDNVMPVWYNILSQKLVTNPVFGVWLSSNPQGSNGGLMVNYFLFSVLFLFFVSFLFFAFLTFCI